MSNPPTGLAFQTSRIVAPLSYFNATLEPAGKPETEKLPSMRIVPKSVEAQTLPVYVPTPPAPVVVREALAYCPKTLSPVQAHKQLSKFERPSSPTDVL